MLTMVLLSAWLCLQDLRTRSVHVLLLAALAFVHMALWYFELKTPAIDIALNVLYLILLFGLLWLVAIVLFKKSLKVMLGLGDVIYLLLVTPLFSFPSFLVWFNLGLILSFVLHLLLLRFSVKYHKIQLIPLAGFLAIIFTFALVIETYVSPITNLIYTP